MIEQYKKTLPAMQSLIASVTLGVLIWSRVWQVAVVFFAIMQVGAVFGAAWAHNLRTRIERRRTMLLMR